jgi:hypothetical protein
MDDGRVLALVAVVSIAPGALVLMVAIIRGYSIHITVTRGQPRRRRREDR